MKTRRGYSDRHAKAGTHSSLPAIECWPNQYSNYDIRIINPEFTSICPKTGLPDFGEITIIYRPKKKCLELKSLKMYMLAYRQLGIFQENVVNRILGDIVKACRPTWAVVKGDFSARGGLKSTMEARKGSSRYMRHFLK